MDIFIFYIQIRVIMSVFKFVGKFLKLNTSVDFQPRKMVHLFPEKFGPPMNVYSFLKFEVTWWPF